MSMTDRSGWYGVEDDVSEQLRAQFETLVPLPVIAEVVREAELDLLGQVRPEAMAEFVHRLATFRLSQLLGDRR